MEYSGESALKTFSKYLFENNPNIKIPAVMDPEDISDGHHTFRELYLFRMLYNAALFNEFAQNGNINVCKARRHSDGEYPFGKDTMFIVSAELPTGQISNHYDIGYWDLFKIPSYDVCPVIFDGHTPQDVTDRLTRYLKS
jgi:hypothetical protein